MSGMVYVSDPKCVLLGPRFMSGEYVHVVDFLGGIMSTLHYSCVCVCVWGGGMSTYTKMSRGGGLSEAFCPTLHYKCSFFPHHTRHIKGIKTPYPESEICSDEIADDYVAIKVYSGLYYRALLQVKKSLAENSLGS